LLRRERLPVADCALAALLGLMLVLTGLGLLMGSPVGVAAIVLLLAHRGLALYNARLRHGRIRRRDLWPATVPEITVALLIALGSR
jgi:hypothetical protein